jgi:hypothetical protein
MNPHWWNDIEEGLVGTQFPFMWDVKQETEQSALLREPNFLGGEIWLDDTDKIKHSEILDMLAAEDAFIRVTREAQTGDLTRVMNELKEEEKKFAPTVRQDMRERMRQMEADIQGEANALTNRIEQLEKEVREMKERLKEPAGTNTTSEAAQ